MNIIKNKQVQLSLIILLGLALVYFWLVPFFVNKANSYKDGLLAAIEYQNDKQQLKDLEDKLNEVLINSEHQITKLNRIITISDYEIKRLRDENRQLQDKRDKKFNAIDSMHIDSLYIEFTRHFDQGI